ncbi:hypothetical protein [Amycolatopsis aidingensis]|uniref:hypothetical protein n=1 Tax=Amycolatopsis aidingensis TaxID=2842453 RepID=UPI001C0B85AB|nr:hypothetical protein [Amycolatopsis aidingensis]
MDPIYVMVLAVLLGLQTGYLITKRPHRPQHRQARVEVLLVHAERSQTDLPR